MANIHIVPASGGWTVEHAGGRDRKFYPNQEDAITAGTEQARQEQVELFIHGRDGQIRERNTFGHDPREVKG